MFEILLIIIIIVFVTWCFQTRWNSRYQKRQIRRGPIALPLIGSSYCFINKDILQVMLDFLRDYEPPFPVWLGNRLFVGIANPKDFEIVLNHSDTLEKDFVYKFAKPIIGTGLLSASVDKWKRNRKLISSTFNQRILNGFVGVFEKQAEIFCKQLEKEIVYSKQSFNILDYTSRYTLDTICETIMGVSVNAQITESEFSIWTNKLLTIISKRVTNVLLVSDFLFNLHPISAEFNSINKKLHNFTEKVIKEKRQEYKDSLKKNQENSEVCVNDGSYRLNTDLIHSVFFVELSQRHSLLYHLIKVSETEANLTDEEIRMEINTFMIGGTDTTASVSAYVFMMIGMFSDVQRKVYEEVLEVIGPHKSVEVQDLSRFNYLERVIKETLRLFPPLPVFDRETTADVQLDNYVVPKGSSVACLIFALQRDANIYSDPLKFDPERFTPEEIAKRHPYSWLPFSAGSRNCLGLKYAMMKLKTLIATAVRKYKFTTDYKDISEIELKFEITLRPIKGHRVVVELRE